MSKYYGDTVCSECGKEIPYGKRRWCEKCKSLKPEIDEGKLIQVLQEKCSLGYNDAKYFSNVITKHSSEIIKYPD